MCVSLWDVPDSHTDVLLQILVVILKGNSCTSQHVRYAAFFYLLRIETNISSLPSLSSISDRVLVPACCGSSRMEMHTIEYHPWDILMRRLKGVCLLSCRLLQSITPFACTQAQRSRLTSLKHCCSLHVWQLLQWAEAPDELSSAGTSFPIRVHHLWRSPPAL